MIDLPRELSSSRTFFTSYLISRARTFYSAFKFADFCLDGALGRRVAYRVKLYSVYAMKQT